MFARIRFWPALAALGALSACPAYAQTATEEALRKRVEELERKLQRLEALMTPSNAAPAAAAADGAAAPAVPVAPAGAAVRAREAALERRVEQLGQEVQDLSRKQASERAAAEAKARTAPVAYAGEDGIGIKSADDAFNLRFRGLYQADSRWFFNDPIPGDQADQFLMRRVRPMLDGTFFGKYGFRIVPEFAGGNATLLDAYLDANLSPQLKIRAGKFKGPIGLERMQSPANIAMIERGFPTQLVPNRDMGIQLSGDLLDGGLSYWAGIFNGTVDGGSVDGDVNSAKDFQARVMAAPFKGGDLGALRGLRLGLAFSVGSQDGSATNSQLPRFFTPGQNVFFTYAAGAFANGQRTRIAPQFFYGNGPLGVIGEYVVSTQDVQRSTALTQVSNTAWHVTATYLLTGEDATLDGVKPSKRFDLKTGDWGAFELAGRVSGLKVDSSVFRGAAGLRLADPSTQPRKALDFGVGINWYLNRFYKVMVNYDFTRFDGGAPNGGDREDEHVLMTRLQLSM